MEGLYRRGSVWHARLVVPRRLRAAIGRSELVQSTGTREPTLARIVASELLAGWRRKLREIDRLCASSMSVDLERISTAHPALSGGGYLPISDAAKLSGFDVETLLREASERRLGLFFRASSLSGYEMPFADLVKSYGEGGAVIEVPVRKSKPSEAMETFVNGLLCVRSVGVPAVANALLAGSSFESMLFLMADKPTTAFVPDVTIKLTVDNIQVSVTEVESLRRRWASRTTPAEIEVYKRSALTAVPAKVRPHATRRVSEAIEPYIRVRQLKCNEEQARRIQSALTLYAELDGDPKLSEIDDDRLARFRDFILPTGPADENTVRAAYGTKTCTESIAVAAANGLKLISAAEQLKRLTWLAGMFRWLEQSRWIERNPSVTLVAESGAGSVLRKSKGRARDARAQFSHKDLQMIFTKGQWFATGAGALTKQGTYREFAPSYYWLPLLGLYTGARITELSQLSLSDIRRTPDGTWFVNLATIDDPEALKKRKNANSERSVPLHPLLITLGLVEWRDKLSEAGHTRLFPELKHDAVKGFGKQSSKWFSAYLRGLGWERNGQRVFHSFRATLVSKCVNDLRLTTLETARSPATLGLRTL